MAVRIITEACADMPKDYVERMGVKVLPLTVNMDGLSFQYNGVDSYEGEISLKEFYVRVREGKMPSTAQATPESFKEAFMEVLNAGDEAIYLAFSSAMSGCFNSANIAKNEIVEEMPEAADRIALVDTLCASLGQTMLIELIARQRDKGASLKELVEYAEANKMRMHHWVAVDDLNHLRRGGRVSGASAFFGTLLAIKPVIHVSPEGKLIPKEKAQGRKKSMNAIVDHMVVDGADPDAPVFIVHGDCLDEAELLAKMVEKKTGRKVDMMNCLGPVVGAHAGPGTLALFYASDAER